MEMENERTKPSERGARGYKIVLILWTARFPAQLVVNMKKGCLLPFFWIIIFNIDNNSMLRLPNKPVLPKKSLKTEPLTCKPAE